MGRKTFRACFAGTVSLGCIRRYRTKLLLIARKEGLVIDEDQSANMSGETHNGHCRPNLL